MSMPRSHRGVEQALGQRANEGVVRVVAQEHDVHVAVQAERQPAVAADRDQCDATTRLATERRVAASAAQYKALNRPSRARACAWAVATPESPRRTASSNARRYPTEVPATGFAERRREPT